MSGARAGLCNDVHARSRTASVRGNSALVSRATDVQDFELAQEEQV